jgi:hypothetical protein
MEYNNPHETPRREKRIKELLELEGDGKRKIDKYIKLSNNKMEFEKYKNAIQCKLTDNGLGFVVDKLSEGNYKDLYRSSDNMTAEAQKEYMAEMEEAKKGDEKSRARLFNKSKKQKKQPTYIKRQQLVKRRGKEYTRQVPIRWEQTNIKSLEYVANIPIRSKEYQRLVNNIVKTTGRTRQAVVKKIQRTRIKNKK